MSVHDDDWPYDEQGFPRKAAIDIDWLLKGAGFEGEASAFDEDDIRDRLDVSFLEVDDNGRVILPTRVHSCECNTTAMYAAAQELARHFREVPRAFPRDLGMVEELRGFDVDNAVWRRWIDTEKSWPLDESGRGKVSLWGCSARGHHCMVERTEDGDILVSGADLNLLIDDVDASRRLPAPGIEVMQVHMDDDLEDEGVHVPDADRDERHYDERTYGDLDQSDDAPEFDEEEKSVREFERDWRESAFPEHDIALYRDAGLELEQVQYLMRFMPPTEVGNWVERFGTDSMIALELLKIGLGDISYNHELLELGDERAPERIAEGIRMALHGYLRKFRQSQKQMKSGSREGDSRQ